MIGKVFKAAYVSEGWIWDDLKRVQKEISEGDMFLEIDPNTKWPRSRTFRHLKTGKTITGIYTALEQI